VAWIFEKRKKSCMEMEILAQAKITGDILNAYITNDGDINLDVPSDITRIIIVASGSSYHCARYAAELFGAISKIEAHAVYSSEFLLEETIAVQSEVLYVFITQSGETTDTTRALEKAKEAGVKTFCITNKENSTIWNESDYKMACLAGEEKSIAATKSFSSQLLCATIMALKFAQNKGVDVYDYILDLRTIPDFIRESFKLQPKIKELARFISKYRNIVITADGQSYALAKEASLKIKETSYIHTNSSILGEFMHGHVAILNNKSSILIYILNDNLSYTAIKNLNKIKENYNPPICVIGNRTNQVKSTYNINIDCEKPIVKTFCIAVIIQLLALEIALKLHRNVDKPHGLNKVVK